MYSVFLLLSSGRPSVKQAPPDPEPTVTALLVAKQEGRTLPKTLEKLTELDYPTEKLEIIVAVYKNDAQTIEAVSPFKERVRLLEVEEELSKPSMLNTSLREAKGEFLLLLDADSLVERESLQLMSGALNHNATAVTGSPLPSNFNSGLLPRLFAVECNTFSAACRAKSRWGLFINSPGFFSLIRKDSIVQIGGWKNDSLAEDCDLSLRLIANSGRLLFSEAKVFIGAPTSLLAFLRQRLRWYRGIMDTLVNRFAKIVRMPLRVGLDALVTLTIPLAAALFPITLLGLALWPTQFALGLTLLAAAEVFGSLMAVRGTRTERLSVALLAFPYFLLNCAVAFVALLSLLFRVKIRWSRTPKMVT